MFRFFESFHFEDGQFYNLDLYQARVNKTFQAIFPAHLPLSLTSLIMNIKPVKGVFKHLISYNPETSSIKFQPNINKPPSSLKIIINNTIKYDFKYEDRSELDQLYKHRSGKDDILVARNG